MAKDYEDQEQTLREEIARYEKELESTKNYQLLSKRRNDLLDKINTANRKIQEQRLPEAGSIKRVGMALDPLSGIYHGIHQANEATKQDASVKTFVKAFGKAYSQAIANQGKTLWTGKDYTLNQKFASDILTKQMGLPDNAATKTLGLAMDISTSPAIYGAYKPAFTLMNYMGKSSAKLASKSATIQKGIDAFGTRFDIFYQAGKTMSAEKMKELKDAYQIAVESRDFTKLTAFRDQFATVAQKVAHPRLAEGKLAFDQMGAVVSGTKTKYVEMLKGQYYAKQSSLASLFKEQTGRDISEKWLSGSGLSMENAAKPLASLSADAKKRVIASLEQWTHIVSPQSQHYKGFARSVLPELKTGGKLDPNKYDNLIGPAKQAWEAAVKKKEAIGAWLKQAENYEAPAKILSATPQAREVTKLMDYVNAPKVYKGISGTIGKGIDKITNAYKYVLSWNPLFNTRNAIGTTWQGLAQIKGNSIGAGLKSYVDAYKMVTGKGKNNPEMYGELAQRGYFKQYGMATNDFGEALHKWNIPAKLANFSESINRTAHTLYMKSGGKSLAEAAESTAKVFYPYGSKYKTAFEENIMARIFPFYDFMKGQVKFWPGELANNGGFWSSAYKVKEATLPDHLKEFPYLRQQWEKGMYTVGNTGGLGFQAEDFQKNITLDAKNLLSQLNPLIKLSVEGAAGYDIFKEKPIQDYGKWLANYNPLQQPINNAISASEGKKSWLSTITSIRDYDFSIDSLAAQTQMSDKNNSSYWKTFGAKFNGSTPSAQEGTQNSVPVTIVGINPSAYKTSTNYPTGGFVAAAQGIPGAKESGGIVTEKEIARGYQTYWFNKLKAGPLSNDPIQNSYTDHLNKMQYAYSLRSTPGIGREGSNELMRDELKHHEATRARDLSKESGPWDPEKFSRIFTLGITPIEQAFNRAQKEYVSILSNIAKVYREGKEVTPDSIDRTYKADLEAYKTRMVMSGWKMDTPAAKAELEKAQRALQYEANTNMENFLREVAKAQASHLENMAEGEIEGIRRLEAQKTAAMAKAAASDEANKFKRAGQMDEYNNYILAISSKFDRKIQEETAKNAKTLADMVAQQADMQMGVLVNSIESMLKSGNINIHDAVGIQSQNLMGNATQKTSNLLKAAQAEMASAGQGGVTNPIISKNTKPEVGMIYSLPDNPNILLKWNGTFFDMMIPDAMLDDKNLFENLSKSTRGILPPGTSFMYEGNKQSEFASSYNPVTLSQDNQSAMLDLGKIINQLDTQGASMSGEDYTKLSDEAMKILIDAFKDNITSDKIKPIFDGLAKTSGEVSRGGQSTADTLRAAQEKLNQAFANFDTYMTNRSITHAKNIEYLPVSSKEVLDANEDARKAELYGQNKDLGKQFQSTAMGFQEELGPLASQKDKSFSDIFEMGESNEDPEAYSKRVQSAIEAEMAITDVTTTEGQNRYNILRKLGEANLEFEKGINENTIKQTVQMSQMRLQIMTSMAGNLAATAETIWQASNGKAKEAFYAMKVLAIAEATLKGYQAAVEAYAQGMKISPAMAAMYAGASMAFTGAQVGAMMSDIVNGPPERKAKGGEITRGSGTKDDVPIMAMRGEYVIRKSAVNRYGRGFMDALNKELLPTSNFAFPDIPASAGNRGFYAEGGEIGRGVTTPVTVNLKNESGHELEQTQSSVDFNGDEYIINVVIDAVQRNKGGMRDIMGGQG